MLKNIVDDTTLMIVDDLSPEDLAMVQSLYSRSAESAEVHIEKVRQAGSGRFMEKYYVGFNHKSIADCGTTTFFIEGVSTLAAKAIQDWPLYSGQETSTRYIDMGKQRIEDPVGSDRSEQILEAWMDFYRSNQDRVNFTVRQRHPITDEERADTKKIDAYDNAVKARTFDILRGFLPAGITTQLSWHSNLRQAWDHLGWLCLHPSFEISTVGYWLRDLFLKQYPASGAVGQAGVSGITDGERARSSWQREVAAKYTYSSHLTDAHGYDRVSLHGGLSAAGLQEYDGILRTRPRGAVLPHFLSDLGQLKFGFYLDFGSFRDIQRHRNGVCRMPLLTTEHGFEPWYLEQLDEELQRKARDLIAFLSDAISSISDDPVVRQYYTPLGFRVPCRVTYALPAALYVMELRSGKTIHPTLRRVVRGMAARFRSIYPTVALHTDDDLDGWTIRRGQQTIVEKR